MQDIETHKARKEFYKEDEIIKMIKHITLGLQYL
jgi:hypothetical protein